MFFDHFEQLKYVATKLLCTCFEESKAPNDVVHGIYIRKHQIFYSKMI